MHFNRRPPSSPAHGSGSLAQEQDLKTELDNHEPGFSGRVEPRGHAGHRTGEVSSGGPRAQASSDGAGSPPRSRTPDAVTPKVGQGRGANGAPRGEVWEQSF